jgi:hypothetical protein
MNSFPPPRRAIFSSHLIPTNVINHDLIVVIIFGDEYKLLLLPLGSIMQPLITSFLHLSKLSPYTLVLRYSLRSSLNVRDQVSHARKPTI